MNVIYVDEPTAVKFSISRMPLAFISPWRALVNDNKFINISHQCKSSCMSSRSANYYTVTFGEKEIGRRKFFIVLFGRNQALHLCQLIESNVNKMTGYGGDKYI